MSNSQSARVPAVLVLGGAFNPVHTQHVALMRLVKDVVEREHHFAINAGALAASHEGYVRTKLKDRAIKARHRLAMCNLAIREQAWLLPCQKTYGSALECGLNRSEFAGHRLLVVLGADRAMGSPERAKWRRRAKHGAITICVGRPGETQRVLEQYQADLQADLVVDPASFLFVTDEVGAASSTLVRSELQRLHDAVTPEEKQAIARQLIEQRLLDAAVAQYILVHEQDLYLK